MNKIQKQVYEKAQDMSFGSEYGWIDCFNDIVFHTTQSQIQKIPDNIISMLKEFIDIIILDGKQDRRIDLQTELIDYLQGFNPELIENKELRKKFIRCNEIWSWSLPVVCYLEDHVKFSTKAKSLNELLDESFLKYEQCTDELLEQFQYDEYIMERYSKRIRDIISVTGYANHLTEDEDYKLNLDIINEIDMNIIDSYPDKRLKNKYTHLREVMYESWTVGYFISEYMLEKEK